MSFGLFASIPYRILQIIVVLVSTGLTVKCIRKFILVRREKNNPLNTLKRLFWVFAILANLSSSICFLVGISGEHVSHSRFRLVSEFVEIAPSFLLLFMQITTLIIIENSIMMANGKGVSGPKWATFLKFVSLPTFVALHQFLFISFTFFTNVILDNKRYIRNDDFEETFSLSAFYYTESYFDIFGSIWDTVGLLEGLLFILVMSRLIPVLRIVYTMMKISDKANRIKKAKLKEWAIFISLCSFVALMRIIISLRSAYECREEYDGEKWINNEKTKEDMVLEDQKRGSEKFYFLENYDLARITTSIIVGIASAFIAPCRKIKKN